MKIFRKIQFIIVPVLLLALGSISLNMLANWHVHKLSDGNIVVHAHPINKTSENSSGQHEHTTWQLFQIDSFNSVFNTDLFNLKVNLEIWYGSFFRYTTENTNVYSDYHIAHKSWRAPPLA